MTRLALVLFLVFFALASAGHASAEKPMSKAAKEKAAKKACAMGDYQRGADILTDLLIETNDPNYIYNQGRCYQQNSHWEQAVSRFREFLRKAKNLSEDDRADTERYIADCEASLAKTSPPAPSPVAPPIPRPATPIQTLAPSPEPVTPEISNRPAPTPSDGRHGKTLRVTGIVFAAVGVAAIGTGVGLAMKSKSLSTKDYSQSRENERSSLKTWGLVSYGVGAAAIATGTVLYIVGWPSEQSSNVAFLPIVAPDGASISLNGRF